MKIKYIVLVIASILHTLPISTFIAQAKLPSKGLSVSEVRYVRALFNSGELNSREGIQNLEKYINSFPEATGENPYPLEHTFLDGIYTREIQIPKGQIIIGKIHLKENIVHVLKGRILVADDQGTTEIVAPAKFISKTGSMRVLYAIEDTIWMNIFNTDCTTVQEVEENLVLSSYEEYDMLTLTDSGETLCLS